MFLTVLVRLVGCCPWAELRGRCCSGLGFAVTFVPSVLLLDYQALWKVFDVLDAVGVLLGYFTR
jgi:hypothetical protein